jgi:TonB family protein
VVEKRIGAVRRCLQPYLKTHPMSVPRVTTRFVINPKGRVESVEVAEPSSNPPDINQCLVNIVEALRFPAPEANGYVKVTYPFILDKTGK